jgi:tetratricopeptide (TPR) repeat protein
MHVTGAMLALGAAGSVEAQANSNTQRPLRPGQTKGPNFLVPVFRSSERGLGMQVSDVVRDRLMSDNLMTSMWVIPKKDLNANLEQSGYSPTDALSASDLKQLATFIRAEEYVDAVVSRGADGELSVVATLNLPRGDGMEQPLTPTSGAKPGDIAARMSDEIEKARKQIKGATDCMQSQRQRLYDEARQHAQRAIREFPQAVFARICLLEIANTQKAPADTLIRIAEEILEIHPQNDRALEIVIDQYKAKVDAGDKAYEEKYLAGLQRLLAADPTNTGLKASVVRALATAGKFDLARPVIDSAVKNSPGDPELVRLQWSVYRAMSDWKGAAAIGEEMIRHDTAAGDTLVYQQLVAAYLSDSQPVKAQEAAARGAAKHQNNATLWLSVVQLARSNGQLPQALEAVNRLLTIDPKNSNAALQKAQIYSEMDQVDSMKVALRAAVDGGASKETAAGMILPKANNLLQAYQRDSAKTVEGGDEVLALFAFADSLHPTPTSGFLQAVTIVVMGQPLLTRANTNKSCEDSRRMNDMLITAQQLVQKHGRDFAQNAGPVMQGAMQMQTYADQYVKAFCK